MSPKYDSNIQYGHCYDNYKCFECFSNYVDMMKVTLLL